MKAAKLANAIKKVAEISDRLDVTSKIMSRVGMGFKKGAGKTGKFIIRNAAGGIVGEAMEYVNGVYKKVKKKTSAHNQFLGTIEGDVEFADGTKGKGAYDLWGKCGSVSNFRTSANQCNTVSEVGAEVAKEGGSILSAASKAAFKAADNVGSIFVKNKHLSSHTTGTYAKFATADISTAQGWVQEGFRSPKARFLPNPQIPNSFQVVTDLGKKIGTKGQTSIRTIVSFDGRVINTFPVNLN
ncbi:hypothetical protein [Emticicia sp. 21SJ11W-3]|uniref:hypothetical protein n=1 Tax=Emticicia sp. 21SJ11W-3 TaxID=2916755 RepID=UPI00209FF9E1|nr:hypothetical protein [Emticicia sp. 21SJ11W-3]UTA67286.1 hypothetical protein MB380_16985 [Emticicia sp. 21SJ11W-3]